MASKDLYSIAEASDALTGSAGGLEKAMTDLSKSKGWSVISRMVSGILPGFWSFQNKLRGITGIFEMYYRGLDKSRKKQLEMLKSSTQLSKALDKFPTGLFTDAGGASVDISTAAVGKITALYNKASTEMEDFDAINRRVTGDGKVLSGPGSTAGKREVLEEIKWMLGDQFEELSKAHKEANLAYKDRIAGTTRREKFLRKAEKKTDDLRDWWQSGDGMKYLRKTARGIGKFLLIITGVALFIFFLYNTIKQNTVFFGKLWETIKFILSGISYGIGLVFVGISEMADALRNADIGGFLLGLAKIIGGILLAVGSLIVAVLVTVVGGLLGLILGGLVEAWHAEEKQGKAVASGIFQLLGWVALIAAAVIWFFSPAGWVGLFGYFAFAVYSAVLLAFSTALGKKAGGGIVTKPMTLVGERGPELVTLPRGSRVYSNAESQRMGGNTINVHVNGRVGASDAEIRDIADKVGREINLRMNRTTNTQTRF